MYKRQGEHFIINVEQPLAFLHHTLRIIRIINRKVAGITMNAGAYIVSANDGSKNKIEKLIVK